MGVLNIPQLQRSDSGEGGQLLSSLAQLLLSSKLQSGREQEKSKLEASQLEQAALAAESSLPMNKGKSPLMELIQKPQGYDEIPETIQRPVEELPKTSAPNPDWTRIPRTKDSVEKASEISLKQMLGMDKTLEERYIGGELPPEESDRYLNLKQTLMPVTTMENGKPVINTVGTKTGKVTRIGAAKPLSISTNQPSQDEIKNAAWKVANGEISLSSIPARSTARMAVINELGSNPAYKDLNLAEVQANIKKKQDLSLIRSNALIQAIDKPMQDMYTAFEELNNSGIVPLNAGANWFLQNTGDPRIAKVNTYRNELVREVQRALVNSGAMAQAGVDQQMHVLNSSYSLPQLKASLKAIDDILQARLETQSSPAFPKAKPAYDPRTQSGPQPVAPQTGTSRYSKYGIKTE